MNDIIKIKTSLEDSVVLIDGVSETVKHEIKKQEGEFYGASEAPLASSLVQPIISSVVKGVSRRGVRRAERRYMDKFLVPLYPLNNIEITSCFRFNCVSSKNNLPRIKNGAYVINLDDKNSKGIHWVSLLIDKNTAV